MYNNINDTEFVVCDVETTGLKPERDRIIEIALIKICQNKIVDTYATLINPKTYIPSFITELTGIKNEDVVNAPTFGSVSPYIREFIGNAVLVAHNASFDYGFLKYEFFRSDEAEINLKTICTKRLAVRLYPNLKSYSLASLTAYHKIKNPAAHRALGDTEATAQLFLKMLKKGSDNGSFDSSDELLTYQYTPKTKSRIIQVRKSLLESISKVPASPGIYYFRKRDGDILYIGKAKNLKKRVNSYFTNYGKDPKVNEILRDAYSLDYTETGSELSAFLLESEEIKKNKPPLNVALKTIMRYSFIRLNTEEEYPYLEVTRDLKHSGDLYFGPFNKIETARTVLEVVSKATLIRECDNKKLNKKRPCYLLNIKRCLGPCINDNMSDEYKSELGIVKQFLTGNNQEFLNRLLRKMKEYSERQKFEEAAEVRDSINSILNNLSKLKVLKEPVNTINALIVIYLKNKISDLILLKNGVLIDYLRASENISEVQMLAEKYFIIEKRDFNNPVNIEKIKIILNYIVNQKLKYDIIYTSNFSSVEELTEELIAKLRFGF